MALCSDTSLTALGKAAVPSDARQAKQGKFNVAIFVREHFAALFENKEFYYYIYC